jgi:protein-disulfide isomerase
MSDKEVSKRQQRKEQIRRKQNQSRLFSIGFITVGVLFLAFLFIYPSIKPIGTIEAALEITYPNAEFNTAGNPDAPIKIEEYADFQCPHCGAFFRTTEKLLMDNYVANGTVQFVFRSFSVLGDASVAAAEAAYCAGDQNKFWEMQGIIFTNQGTAQLTERRLIGFAEEIDLDMSAFNECYNAGKYADTVEQDNLDGIAAGVQATPTFIMTYIVNGETKTKTIEGAQSFDAFQQEIEAALAEMNQ